MSGEMRERGEEKGEGDDNQSIILCKCVNNKLNFESSKRFPFFFSFKSINFNNFFL